MAPHYDADNERAHAHDQQQFLLDLGLQRLQVLGIGHGLAVVVDGAGADDDEEAVVALLDDFDGFIAALTDGFDGAVGLEELLVWKLVGW